MFWWSPCLLYSHRQQRTEFPVTDNVQTIPPPYVVRIILIYSRPSSQPSLTLTETMKVSLVYLLLVVRVSPMKPDKS